MDNWLRREHYKYYTGVLKIQYNMTANVRVKKLIDYCHLKGKRFYLVLIYLVSKTVNSIDNFKIFMYQQGDLCVWDHVVPNYTIFHDDDKTFSDCWTEYDDDFDTFYQRIAADIRIKRVSKPAWISLRISTVFPVRRGQRLLVLTAE